MDLAAKIAAAAARLDDVAVDVTYHRGDWATALRAVRGETEIEISDAYGTTTLARSDDWLCNTADLTVAGDATLPQAGDRIVYEHDGRRETYEVGHPAAGDPYRLAGPHRQRIRIHTRLVESSP